MASTKSLPSVENEFLRGLVQKVLDSAATQTEAAKRLGVSQSYLNEFVGGTRGAGPKLLKGLARIHPKLSARLLGLGEVEDGAPRTPDPRTIAERAVDEEFLGEFERDLRGAVIEAVQYASERGPRFFRHTWWRLLIENRSAVLAGAATDPITIGERLVARARAADDDARRNRAAALQSKGHLDEDEDDQRPTLPAPGKKAPARRGTRRDTPSAKRGR